MPDRVKLKTQKKKKKNSNIKHPNTDYLSFEGIGFGTPSQREKQSTGSLEQTVQLNKWWNTKAETAKPVFQFEVSLLKM